MRYVVGDILKFNRDEVGVKRYRVKAVNLSDRTYDLADLDRGTDLLFMGYEPVERLLMKSIRNDTVGW